MNKAVVLSAIPQRPLPDTKPN